MGACQTDPLTKYHETGYGYGGTKLRVWTCGDLVRVGRVRQGDLFLCTLRARFCLGGARRQSKNSCH